MGFQRPIFNEDTPAVPPTSYSDVLTASYEPSFESNTEVGAIANMNISQDFKERGTMMSVEDLQERYKDSDLDWTEPMPDLAAQFRVDQAEDNKRRQAIIEHGNPGFLKGTLTPIVGSMGAILGDPIGATINFASAGLGRVATASKVAGRLGRITKLAKAGRVATAGKALKATAKAAPAASAMAGYGAALATNITENSLSEIFVAAGQEAVYEEYTAEEFLNNAITSSLIFTSAASGLGAMVSKIGGRNADALMDAAEASLDAGKSPSKLITEALEHAEQDIKIDPTFNKGFTESFPDMELTEEDTLMTAFKKITDAHAEGKIDEASIQGFKGRLEQSGFDMDKMSYAEDNAGIRYTDKFLQDSTENMKKPSSDLGFDEQAAKNWDNQPELDVNAGTKKLDANEALIKEVDDPKIKAEFQRADADSKTFVTAAKDFGTCIVNLAKGIL